MNRLGLSLETLESESIPPLTQLIERTGQDREELWAEGMTTGNQE